MNDAANKQPPFAEFLGLKITHVPPERSPQSSSRAMTFNNRFGIMHGGRPHCTCRQSRRHRNDRQSQARPIHHDHRKQNKLFAAVPIGDVAKAECTPLHRGRTTMVWQTRITRGDGKLCALVTQTQLVLERGK
jgi:acyl-coenzyme A thioesterase PaaI-like protein